MSEEGLIKKTKRRLRELYYGDRTYLPGHKKPKVKKKTKRTKQIESQAQKNFGTDIEAELARLRGEK